MHPLIVEIRDTIKKLKESNEIQQNEEFVRRWSVTDFAYTESGISKYVEIGEVVKKFTWFKASFDVFLKVMASKRYGAVMHFLSSLQFQKMQAPIYLQRYCNKMILDFLNSDEIDENKINEFVDIFISDVKDLPCKVEARVGLTGIILESDEIQVDVHNKLKKPKKEDFEREENIFHDFPHHRSQNPSAFLEISITTDNQSTVTEAIEKAIVIFRFFHLGTVRSTAYRIYSPSIFFGIRGWGSSSVLFSVLEQYLLKNSEVENFTQFWTKFSPKIPDSFYKSVDQKNDFVTISYSRYSDALLNDGQIEQRIASAIMGMESIFLKSGGENAELQFRLSLRVAQLLKNISYNPLLVKRAIKDAYEIRSIFLHGDQISTERKQKIAAKYGDNIHNLLLLTLDFLRISLIISMTIPVKKGKFIEILDDSLLSQELNNQLEQIIADGKSIVLLSKIENQFAFV